MSRVTFLPIRTESTLENFINGTEVSVVPKGGLFPVASGPLKLEMHHDLFCLANAASIMDETMVVDDGAEIESIVFRTVDRNDNQAFRNVAIINMGEDIKFSPTPEGCGWLESIEVNQPVSIVAPTSDYFLGDVVMHGELNKGTCSLKVSGSIENLKTSYKSVELVGFTIKAAFVQPNARQK